MSLSVGELKRRLTEAGVDFSNAVEKRELQELLRQHMRMGVDPDDDDGSSDLAAATGGGSEVRLRIRLERSEDGLGLQIGALDHTIVGIDPGSKAADSGLATDDRIVAVDGVGVAGRSLRELLTPDASSYDLTVHRSDGHLASQLRAHGLC